MATSRKLNARVLVVDGDGAVLKRLASAIDAITSPPVVQETRSARAAERLAEEHFDLLVADLVMPALDGLELLRLARARNPEVPVMIVTGHPSVEMAAEAMRLGAVDYVTKPVELVEFTSRVRRLLTERQLRDESRFVRRHIARPWAADEIIASNAAMLETLESVQRIAESGIDVLILGETGTGKELVARAIHARSGRDSGRFVPIDCGAIPEHLLESMFFGYERGAFTGAQARSLGLMEFADGGSFFLDEVDALTMPLAVLDIDERSTKAATDVAILKAAVPDVRIIAVASSSSPDDGRVLEQGVFYYMAGRDLSELVPVIEAAARAMSNA